MRYIRISTELIRELVHVLCGSELEVFFALCYFCDRKGVCKPRIKTISKVTDLSPRSVVKHVRTLQGLFFIKIVARPGRSNIYIVPMNDKGVFVGPTHAENDTPAEFGRGYMQEPAGPTEQEVYNNIYPLNPPKGKRKKKLQIFREDTLQYKLSRLLRLRILSNNDNAKVPVDTPEALAKWAGTIDLLMKDGREPRDIAKVIVWCQLDDFWCSVILTPAKLRSKYDQLWLKMKKESKQPRGYNSPELYR